MKKTLHSPLALTAVIVSLTLGSATAEVRQWTNSAGKSITGELKGVVDDKASIVVGGRTFEIPVATLSAADQTFIKTWQAKAGSPAGETVADPAKAYDTPVMKALEKNLVALDGRKITEFTLAAPEKIEVLAFYSSASWCGPCHAFTPELARAYKTLKRKYDNFEVVLLTADDEKSAWEGYVQEYKMPFPSVNFDASAARSTLRAGKNSNFIPAIHIVTRGGEVLDDSSAGARASLEKLEKILKERGKKAD